MAAETALPIPITRLVIASTNPGKIREFRQLLSGLPLEIEAQPEGLEVEETGTTFTENARLKAIAVARHTGAWTLADDSGLSVDALGGAPGVFSARYASSDGARIERLLEELALAQASLTTPNRAAHFASALAVAQPSGSVHLEVEGRCDGVILDRPRGSGGFGYDPIFLDPETGLTYAEMDAARKGKVGHRGRAFAKLAPLLSNLVKA
jgi:XTP/dITP diphosphohydrolase